MKIFAAFISIAVLGIASYFLFFRGMSAPDAVEITEEPFYSEHSEEPIPQPTIPEPTPLPEEVVTQADLGNIPDLESSDEYLKDLATKKKEWQLELPARDLIRNAVTAIERISRNQNPNGQLGFLQPDTSFQVTAQDDRFFLTQENYARYDELISSLKAVDFKYAALVYRHIFPVMLEAYNELGNGDQAFPQKLAKVFTNVLNFEYPEGPLELAGKDGSYIFVDESLEAASPLEKALLRMGPEHTKTLQEKIREFKAALEAP